MPCPTPYVPIERRSPEDILNDERDAAFAKLEAELANGQARIETDPITGVDRVVGLSADATPTGMSDLCVLAGLQTRNSLEWQLAAGQAGVQEKQYAAAHAHAHSHGHKH